MAGGELSADVYLQGKPCPKCGHVRSAADTNPEWQCPKCQIAYLKYRPGGARLASRLAAGGREMATEAKADRSVYALIAANALALLIAWLTKMSLRELMLVYWIQSVIIGVMSVIRILSLQRFSTENFQMNDAPVPETTGSKVQVAVFFVMHYGIFHAVYLLFIVVGSRHAVGGSAVGYLLCALVFAVNHGYSMLQNVRRDAQGRPNLGTLMFLPYGRIVPMHLTIVAGGAFTGSAHAFALFGFLKVVADVIMHTVEHHVLAKGSVLPPPD
jgi:ribosomal protein S27AE